MAIRLVKVEEVTEEERAWCRDGWVCAWCGAGKYRKLLCNWCAAGRAPIHVACWLEALDPAFYLRLISGKGIAIYVPDSEEERAGAAPVRTDGLRRPEPPFEIAQAQEPPPLEMPPSAPAETAAPPGDIPIPPPTILPPRSIPPPPSQRGWWRTVWSEDDPD